MIDKFKYSREHVKDTNIFLLKVNDNMECINGGIIPDSQLLNIRQYKLENDRNKRLLARSFLYTYLKDNYQITNFDLEYNQYQKPSLQNNKGIDFSISYSKDYILVAVSDKHKIGVDIECIDKTINHRELKEIIMHQNEIEHYNQLVTDEDKLDFFFEVFNTKESIIKSMGIGLYFDIRNLNTLDASSSFLSIKIYKKLNLLFKCMLSFKSKYPKTYV